MKFTITQQDKIHFLIGLFVACIILANIAGMKIVTIGKIDVSTGILPIVFAFFITDILTELKGKRFTDSIIWSTCAVLLLCYLFIMMALHLEPATRFTQNEEFKTIFNTSSRFILASLAAFLMSQLNDVWNFMSLKKATRGRWLWLRSNVSSIVSQFIDTVIFMFLAFYHLTPKFTADYVWALIWPYFILKVVLTLVDTPLIYLVVRWVRNSKENV